MAGLPVEDRLLLQGAVTRARKKKLAAVIHKLECPGVPTISARAKRLVRTGDPCERQYRYALIKRQNRKLLALQHAAEKSRHFGLAASSSSSGSKKDRSNSDVFERLAQHKRAVLAPNTIPTFKPKVNDRSLQLARTLSSTSSERLLSSARNGTRGLKQGIDSAASATFRPQINSRSEELSQRRNEQSSDKRRTFQRLYEDHKQHTIRKSTRSMLREQMAAARCTFRPTLNSTAAAVHSDQPLPIRAQHWLERKNLRLAAARQEKEVEELQACTHTPRTSSIRRASTPRAARRSRSRSRSGRLVSSSSTSKPKRQRSLSVPRQRRKRGKGKNSVRGASYYQMYVQRQVHEATELDRTAQDV